MFSQRCIKCCEEFGAEDFEVPIESDGTLLLSTLQSVFPDAKGLLIFLRSHQSFHSLCRQQINNNKNLQTGLKFKNPLTNCYRVVKLDESQKLHAPGINADDPWGCELPDLIYICTFPRSADSAVVDTATAAAAIEAPAKVPQKLEEKISTLRQQKTMDLIVLQLSPQTSEADLRGYFEESFGPLIMAEIKRDRQTGNSRRFAFIRFQFHKDEMKALNCTKQHKINGQVVRVALPDYRDPSEVYRENKCFIGRVNEAIKPSDLKEFFGQFGEIDEISYPKKFKGYAFITFADREVAQKLCGNDFIIKGYSVCVSKSTNGSEQKQQQQQMPASMNSQSSNWFQEAKAFSPNLQNSPYMSSMLERNNPNSYYGNPSIMNANVNPLNVLSMAMQGMGMLGNHQMGGAAQNVS